jgi:FAD/FMN-containing dehydrogenase
VKTVTIIESDIRTSETMVDGGRIEEFRRLLSGELACPGDHGYDAARAVWNGMIDRRPALIAYCVTRQDVVEAVNFACRTGILTAVRSGGHNIAGASLCDGGLVIDLSRMNRVTVVLQAAQPAQKEVRCSPISTRRLKHMGSLRRPA